MNRICVLLVLILSLFADVVHSQNQSIDSVDIYINRNDFLRGLTYAKKQAQQHLKNKNYLGYSKSTEKAADIFLTLNDSGKALKTLLDGLRIVDKYAEKQGEIILMSKLGSIYVKLKNYDEAKKYYYSAIAKAHKIKNDSLAGRLAQPLFRIHFYTENDSAEYYLKKTLDYSRSVGTNKALSTGYTNYFGYYNSRNEYAKSKIYLDSSLYYARRSESTKTLSIALSNLVYYQMVVEQDFPKAKKTYREIFELTPNDTLSEAAADIYLNYSYLLEQLHDYKGSNLYMQKVLEIMDVTFSEKNDRALRDLEIRYKIDKVDQQYRARQKELEENQSKNRKFFMVFIGLLLLSLILFYFFYQNARLKQKNRLKDIESRVQQNIINATIDGQENERKKIAAVLHDNISAMLSSAGLHLSAFVAGNPSASEEISKTRAILRETHDKVRDLSHELVPVLLAKFGLHYAIVDLCEKNSNSVIRFRCESTISQKKRYNDEFEMKMYFIITELFNNIIKHSNASEATVELTEKDGMLKVVATDNGIGFDTSKPHLNEGFGLTQIRARVSNMKGNVSIVSRPGSGTIISITVPVVE